MRTNTGGPDLHHLRAKDGFSLIELLVVISIIALLAGLLLPALSKARESSNRAACLNNARALAVSTLMYANDDSKGRFTPHKYRLWPIFSHNSLWRYANLSLETFVCPSTANGIRPPLKRDPDGTPYYYDLIGTAARRTSPKGSSYDVIPFFADMENFWNGHYDFKKTSRAIPKTIANINSYAHKHPLFGLKGMVTGPSTIWLYTDADTHEYRRALYPDPENNHRDKGCNVSFVDGHAEWVPRSKVVQSHETSQDNNRARRYPRQ